MGDAASCVLRGAGALLLLSAAGWSQAQVNDPARTWPAREIRFVVPFPPGGGNDVVGRIVARRLQAVLGREVIVENRGAAGGTAGTVLVAKAPPDGHTLLINNVSLAVNATLMPNLPFDVRKDLAPVSIVGQQPSVMLVRADLPAPDVRAFVALARAKPDGLAYGSGGPGSSAHLATERLQQAVGIRMAHVPYKGLAQAVADLGAGRVDMVIATTSTALAALGRGRVRALAVTTAQRSRLLPELPTMIEAGVPDFQVDTWYAVFVPARTPAAIVGRLNGALKRVAGDPDVAGALAKNGVEASHTTAAAAAAHIRAEIDRWARVIKASGIKPR